MCGGGLHSNDADLVNKLWRTDARDLRSTWRELASERGIDADLAYDLWLEAGELAGKDVPARLLDYARLLDRQATPSTVPAGKRSLTGSLANLHRARPPAAGTPGRRSRLESITGNANRWSGSSHQIGPGKFTRTLRLSEQRGLERNAGGERATNTVTLSPAAKALSAARAHGTRSPLPFRAELERSFGRSFAQVEILSGPGAERAAASIDATAFAAGNTVVLPSSASRSLVAHELSHVVQQGGDKGNRVDDSALAMSSPGDAVEVEAHRTANAVSLGRPLPSFHTATGAARLARATPSATTTTATTATAATTTDASATQSVADRVKIILPPSSFPALHQHVIDAITEDPKLEPSLDAEDKKALIAIGRKRWRKKAGSAGAFIEQLVDEIGGQGAAAAKIKITQLGAEQSFETGVDAAALKDRFWGFVADLLIQDEWLRRKDPVSAFQQVIKDHLDNKGRFVRRGRVLEVPTGSPFLSRTTTLGGFYQWNMTQKAKADILGQARDLLDAEHQDLVVPGPAAPAAKLSAFDYWAYRCATNPAVAKLAHTTLDTKSKYGGGNQTTWWSYAGMTLKPWGPHPADQARGFKYLIQAAGLLPEWYETGAMYITLDAEKLAQRQAADSVGQLRKPTAFDGLLSPLYEPNVDENGWGITSGRLPEAVAPHIPAELTVPGEPGLRPFVQDATARFDRIARAVSVGPSERAKKEFAGGNRPFPMLLSNPAVHFTIPGDATGTVSIASPVVTTPGVKAKKVEVVLGQPAAAAKSGSADRAKPAIKRGTVVADIDAGGAIKRQGAKLKISPSATGGVDGTAADSAIDKVQSPLEKILGRIKPTARITNAGVEASATVTPGPSGIPGFNLDSGSIKLSYTKELQAEGKVAISHKNKKTGLKGEVGATWDGSQLGVQGELKANEGLIAGLDPLRVQFRKAGDRTTVSAERVAFKKTIGGIELSGQARNLDYDVSKASLAGTLDLSANLGMLGKAKTSAKIAANKLDKVSFQLKNSKFSYPKAKPLINGVVDGAVNYRGGKFSGSLTGDASLSLPGAVGGGAQQVVGLRTDMRVSGDGTYSGSIKTKGPVQFGKYLTITKASLKLGKGGGVNGTVSAKLSGNIPFLEKGASITWQVTDGVPKIKSVNAKLSGTLARFSKGLKLDLQVTEQGIKGSIAMAAGPSPIKGIKISKASKLEFSFAGGKVVAGGTLNIAHDKGYFTKGSIRVAWNNGWKISGSATVGKVIPCLDGFVLAIEEDTAGGLRISAKNVAFNQTLKSIKLTGKVGLIEYDTKNGTFGGDVTISKVDLGMFGTATATGKIVKNELREATFNYTAPTLRFPRTGTPVIAAENPKAKLAYKKGKFSGRFSGTAKLNIPKIGESGEGGLKFDVRVGSDGSYSGSFAAKSAITIRNVLKIYPLTAKVSSDGGLTGKFSVKVQKVPFIKKGQLDFAFSNEGIKPTGAKIELAGALAKLGAKASLEAGESGIKGSIELKGNSGIAGFDLTSGSMTIGQAPGGALTASGGFGFAHKKLGITGNINIGWDGKSWTYDGKGTAKAGLVDGLSAFEVGVKKDQTGTTITGGKASYKRALSGGAITLEGKVAKLEYNTTSQTFSGDFDLGADLGMLGKASAKASIVKGKVSSGAFTYKSNLLTYPTTGTPLISGKIQGTVTYENDRFSGSVTSDATFAIPGKLASDPVSAKVYVKVSPEGGFSGSLTVKDEIKIGKYFRINGLKGTVKEGGDIESSFTIDLVNAKFLGEGGGAQLKGKIDKTGLHPEAARITFAYGGGVDNSKAGGTCTLSWDESAGLGIDAKGHYRINKDLVAKGSITYSKDKGLSAKLGVDKISLLKDGSLKKKLFEVEFSMPIFSVGIAGAFIEAGFSLGFELGWGLSVEPSVELKGLDLNTFEFEEAKAKMKFDGELSASLVGRPELSIGLFVLHPWVVSGSGGIAAEVTAKAAVKPSITPEVSYRPDGGLSGGLSAIELPVTFELKAAILGLLKVSALGDTFSDSWEKTFGETTLVEETELMRHTVDFADMSETDKPAIPTERQPAKAPASGAKVAEQTKTKEGAKTPAATENTAAETKAPKSADEGDGFDLQQLIGMVRDEPGFQKIQGVIESGAEAYGKIKGVLKAVLKFFTGWIGDAFEAIAEALKGIAQHEDGLFGYVRDAARKWMGDDLFEIFAPIFDQLVTTGDTLMKLFEHLGKPEASFDWVLDFVKLMLDLSWGSIKGMVSAIGKVVDNVGTHAPPLINRMVQEGTVGVQRHPRYIWNPNPWGSNWWFLAADEYKLFGDTYKAGKVQWPRPAAAVAYGLWNGLEMISGVHRTDTRIEKRTGDPYNDYWVDNTREVELAPWVLAAMTENVYTLMLDADDPKKVYDAHLANDVLDDDVITTQWKKVCAERSLDPRTGRRRRRR